LKKERAMNPITVVISRLLGALRRLRYQRLVSQHQRQQRKVGEQGRALDEQLRGRKGPGSGE
jgi:hypothetical protein